MDAKQNHVVNRCAKGVAHSAVPRHQRLPWLRGGWYWGLALTALVPLALLLATSCTSVSPVVVSPPEIEGASPVGNQACADCHGNLTRVFNSSAHGRHYQEGAKGSLGVGCESCHGPGSRHVAVGRAQYILNPGRDPSTCLQCHLGVAAEFSQPYHHPVPEGRMNCTECHDPHGPDIRKPAGGLGFARSDESCAACHREQVRPFVFEHEAMREGCATCHATHGSINRKLLVDRDANLCLRCHAQVQDPDGRIRIGLGKVDHTESLKLGTCYTAGCHSAVHGSNVSPKLRY